MKKVKVMVFPKKCELCKGKTRLVKKFNGGRGAWWYECAAKRPCGFSTKGGTGN